MKLSVFGAHFSQRCNDLFHQSIAYHRFESHVKTPLGLWLMLSSIAFAVWAVYCPGASYLCSGSHVTALDQLNGSIPFG